MGWVLRLSFLLLFSSSSLASPFPPLRTADGHSSASPLFIAGIFRGCDREGRLDQAIERRLNKGGVSVQLLRQPSGDALPVC
jgi:hypothetical protein